MPRLGTFPGPDGCLRMAGLPLFAVNARGGAHHPTEAAVEGRKIIETGIEGDRRSGPVRLSQADGSAMQARVQDILVRGHADGALEGAQQAKGGEFSDGSQFVQGHLVR